MENSCQALNDLILQSQPCSTQLCSTQPNPRKNHANYATLPPCVVDSYISASRPFWTTLSDISEYLINHTSIGLSRFRYKSLITNDLKSMPTMPHWLMNMCSIFLHSRCAYTSTGVRMGWGYISIVNISSANANPYPTYTQTEVNISLFTEAGTQGCK
jgi:hypothetical protein